MRTFYLDARRMTYRLAAGSLVSITAESLDEWLDGRRRNERPLCELLLAFPAGVLCQIRYHLEKPHIFKVFLDIRPVSQVNTRATGSDLARSEHEQRGFG